LIARARNFNTPRQYLFVILLVSILAGTLYFFVDLIGHQVVALILLLGVSLLAMVFDIFPVLTAAALSALIWNYFFIPPTFTFHISTAEDALMFLMYFVVSMINAVLTFQIRQNEKSVSEKKEKENTIKLYNTLLNSLSHELRTPIATIIGAIDTIEANNTRITEKDRVQLYREIHIAAFRLNQQVENLLSMSRLEAGVLKPKPDWCDVNELIHLVVKNLRDVSPDHSIHIKIPDELPLFKIDQGLLEQVIFNLVHNAIRHTPSNSTITIEVKKETGNCVVTVSDNGPGFPENKIEEAFEMFNRMPGTSTGGTGLGLSIARGFTEAMNGSIYLENNNSGGAKFTVVIPAESSALNGFSNE